MYEVLQNHLTHGNYTLRDAEGRIDYSVAVGRITPEQAEELRVLAAEKADETGGIEDELQALRQEMTALTGQVDTVTAALLKTADLSLSAAKREQVQAVFAVAGAQEEAADSEDKEAQEY